MVAGSVWAGGLLSSHRSAATRRDDGQATRLRCPASYAGPAPWVPATPAGVDGRARLTPPRTPTSALVCAYVGSTFAKRQVGWALSGRRRLTAGLGRLAGQLSWQPRLALNQQIFCAGAGGKVTNYLLGLTYPGGGAMWVTATKDFGDCGDTSNGVFTSFGVVGPDVSRAFASGRWPARQPVSCGQDGPDVGRLGQDTAMVPASPTSLTICAAGAHTFTSGYQALATALKSLPTHPSTNSCTRTRGRAGPSYQLLFSYPQGPPVLVIISSDCKPGIDNLSLQSNSATSILPIIAKLLTPK